VNSGERGITLVEVLVAVIIIAVGLVAITTGMHTATAHVANGQQHTTAALLAEQRLEDIRAFVLSLDAAQGWSNITAATFAAAETYGSIATHPAYRRTTSITAAAGSATQKLATVTVFWKPIGVASSNSERSVQFSTLLTVKR